MHATIKGTLWIMDWYTTVLSMAVARASTKDPPNGTKHNSCLLKSIAALACNLKGSLPFSLSKMMLMLLTCFSSGKCDQLSATPAKIRQKEFAIESKQSGSQITYTTTLWHERGVGNRWC